jgi:PAS domain S-box-containing protein
MVWKRTVTRSQEYAESIINTVCEPLIALDQDLRVVTVSRSFYDFFKVKPEETVGQLIYDLGNKQWDIPKLRELLETILPQKATFDNYEVEHDFATIGRRIMLLNARQIQRVLGKERIILLAIEDITERKRAEKERERLIRELQDTLAKVKQLSGMLPICSSCKQIRNDKGYWSQVEVYIRDNSEAEFTHGICPECMKKLYPDFADNKNSV